MDAMDKEFTEAELDDLRKDSREIDGASILIEGDTIKLQKSIELNEIKIRAVRKETDELHAKIALLSGRSKCLQESSLISEELSHRIEARLAKWKNALKGNREKTYFNKTDGTNSNAHRGLDLEPACQRKVRLACEQIITLKKKQLLKEMKDESSDANEPSSKDQLWTTLEELLADFHAKEILESLNENTLQATKTLQSKTKQVDLSQDAEELRFKFESGKLKDVSQQPALLRSVDQLIEQGQSAHFQRFLEAEKAKNDVWRERKRFEKAQQIINNALHKKYGSKVKELNLRRRVLDFETGLYGIEAAISYTKELVNDLVSQRETKRKAEESLLSKYRKIHEFEEKAQRKQLMIQALVKRNGSARSHLEQQRNELNQYLRNQISILGSEIDSKVKCIKGKHTKELQMFSSLQISRLKSIDSECGSRVPYEDMSIHLLEQTQGNASQVLKPMANALQLPGYAALEELLFKIRDLKEAELESISQREISLSQNAEMQSEAFVQKLAKMQEKCKVIAEKAELKKRQTLPILQSSFANVTDALKECLDLEKMIHAWWDQPAQFFVPWIKEDGMNLRQWYTQWEVNAARLAQMQLLK